MKGGLEGDLNSNHLQGRFGTDRVLSMFYTMKCKTAPSDIDLLDSEGISTLIMHARCFKRWALLVLVRFD